MKKWNCNFELGDSLTEEQLEFFDKHGVIIFRNFLSQEKVGLYLNELKRLENEWLSEKKEKVNGIPLKFGKDEAGNRTLQRLCFTSLYSKPLHELLDEPKLQALTELLGPYEGRIGENEKDGLVINNYINTSNSTFTQMGWHTDSPRDLFLGQKIMPMLNVGLHLDTCLFENGGLRILPGTHKQNVMKLLFGKKYFIDNTDDDREVGFDINAGDLTVHDGRTWHRVKQSPLVGEASRRRVMYIPIITGKYKPKHEKSKTPFYHKLASKVPR
jgi:ectoine hydroxylase-related dioxygenase (phytanoyl-CoA dioxygenase family)